jgi:hypothetical protein
MFTGLIEHESLSWRITKAVSHTDKAASDWCISQGLVPGIDFAIIATSKHTKTRTWCFLTESQLTMFRIVWC